MGQTGQQGSYSDCLALTIACWDGSLELPHPYNAMGHGDVTGPRDITTPLWPFRADSASVGNAVRGNPTYS